LRLGLLALSAALLTACGSTKTKTVSVSSSSNLSPTELALAHIRAGETQAVRVATSAQSSPEGGGPTTVTVLQEGLADDSVAAVKTVLRYEPQGESWRLVSSQRTQKCQPGRGHQKFAAGDCV
jgi:hypothetical protein